MTARIPSSDALKRTQTIAAAKLSREAKAAAAVEARKDKAAATAAARSRREAVSKEVVRLRALVKTECAKAAKAGCGRAYIDQSEDRDGEVTIKTEAWDAIATAGNASKSGLQYKQVTSHYPSGEMFDRWYSGGVYRAFYVVWDPTWEINVRLYDYLTLVEKLKKGTR